MKRSLGLSQFLGFAVTSLGGTLLHFLYDWLGEAVWIAPFSGVNESTLRYWEKEFEQLAPRKAGRGVRQYTQKDIDLLKLIYHLVKEKGMTLKGAKSRLAVNKEKTDKNFEVVSRLKLIRQELMDMKQALDAFTYTQVEDLKITSH